MALTLVLVLLVWTVVSIGLAFLIARIVSVRPDEAPQPEMAPMRAPSARPLRKTA